jgi:hypothetical protein
VSRGWATVLLWGIFLAILALLHLAFTLRSLQLGLALGAAAGVVILAVLVGLRPPYTGARLLPDLSYATVMVAVGLAMVGAGVIFGQWLWLIGVGVLVLGGGGLVREYRAARRSAR